MNKFIISVEAYFDNIMNGFIISSEAYRDAVRIGNIRVGYLQSGLCPPGK